MRSIACALGGIVLLTCCSSYIRAEESNSSRWWPFGPKKEVVTPPRSAEPLPSTTPALPPRGPLTTPLPPTPRTPVPPTAPPAPNDEKWMLKTSKGKVGWPHLTKPHLPNNPFAKQEVASEPPRNTWVEPTPEPPKPSLFKPITAGAHKVAQGTKKAWHKTIDVLTPGEPEPPAGRGVSSRIAQRDAEPSFWQKMFGGKEEVQQPETVPQWMAQKRLEP